MGRFSFALLLLSCLGVSNTGCSNDMPPPLGDTDAHVVVVPNDAARNGPCDPPQQGCPCTVGSDPVYCGTVYRYSAGHTDCSKGYITCDADGGYGPCVGASIFMGD